MNTNNPFPIIPVLGLCGVFVFLVLVIAFHARRMRRAWNADHIGNCTCGYPIGGLQTDRCPECGKVHEALTKRIQRQGADTLGFLCSSALLLWIASRITTATARWVVPPVFITPQVLVVRSLAGDIEVRWDVVLNGEGLRVDEVNFTSSSRPGTPVDSTSPVTLTITANDWARAFEAKGGSGRVDSLMPIPDSAAGLSSSDRSALASELAMLTTLALTGTNAELAASVCGGSPAFSSIQCSNPPMRTIPRFPNWAVYVVAGLAWVEIARRAARRHWAKTQGVPVQEIKGEGTGDQASRVP